VIRNEVVKLNSSSTATPRRPSKTEIAFARNFENRGALARRNFCRFAESKEPSRETNCSRRLSFAAGWLRAPVAFSKELRVLVPSLYRVVVMR